MKLLDLYCKAGGGATGYYRAGFTRITGVDRVYQPRYPFTFALCDAMTYAERFGKHYDVIHASPPCQGYSTARSRHSHYPEVIPQLRALLQSLGKPYIIENVRGAPLRNFAQVCGSALGLNLRRHRLFESSLPLRSTVCDHKRFPHPYEITGRGGPSHGHHRPRTRDEMRAIMGIPWMTRAELVEALPPPYTEYIGKQVLESIGVSP